MPTTRSEERQKAQQLYALTEQLHVQLEVLGRSPGSFTVDIQPTTPTTTGGGDIEAIAFIVLMQASRSASEDLRAVMDQVQAINKAKAALRDVFVSAKRGRHDFEAIVHLLATVSVHQIEDDVEDLIDHLDSMSELGETESLRLQMAMDRLSKFMSTLSNLLKKASDTSSAIVQNIK